MSIRVVLVDDQPLLRSGFELMLSVEDDIEVVAQAANGQEAITAVSNHPEVDVVLMDVQMPVMDGIAATREIVSGTDAKVVILTTFDREDYLFDALRAGASGFLLKNTEPRDLVAAIRAVAGGQALLSPEVTLRVINAAVRAEKGVALTASLADPLTEREREVLRLLAAGSSNAEIGQALSLAEPTVKTHVSNLLAKIGVRDRLQAVVFAYRHGLHA